MFWWTALGAVCVYPCILLGPDFWGLVHKQWRICKSGKMQVILNSTTDGDGVPAGKTSSPSLTEVVVSGVISFTKVRYPAEIQMLAFNSDLYTNFTEAMRFRIQPRGLLGISIIVDIGETTNAEFRRLTVASKNITFKNTATRLEHFQPANLLPKTDYYVTYEGSLTFPGCYETVTWVLLNSPIYTTIENLAIWNQMQQSEENSPPNNPSIPMAPNFRPLRAVNGRLIRSNINIKLTSSKDGGSCPSNIYLDPGYRTNPKRVSQLQQHQRYHLSSTAFGSWENMISKDNKNQSNANGEPSYNRKTRRRVENYSYKDG